LAGVAFAQKPGLGKEINFYSIENEIALGRQLAAQFQRNTTP
jgi:hypothetical protein